MSEHSYPWSDWMNDFEQDERSKDMKLGQPQMGHIVFEGLGQIRHTHLQVVRKFSLET